MLLHFSTSEKVFIRNSSFFPTKHKSKKVKGQPTPTPMLEMKIFILHNTASSCQMCFDAKTK